MGHLSGKAGGLIWAISPIIYRLAQPNYNFLQFPISYNQSISQFPKTQNFIFSFSLICFDIFSYFLSWNGQKLPFIPLSTSPQVYEDPYCLELTLSF